MNTYETVSGDTWDLIAYKVFNNENKLVDLMKANPDYISTVIFSANVTLTIPELTETPRLNLPPWKRGL
ncbi:tail protein X [Paenalkalicoccus suaedae]|uniref:Tail protein X n=1 Tax=Paenalkalicoccus suaedae TaxID=2592382 RepID=A0A859FAJ1_9BACI|nr:tail protein X [Paenalkalicoccus suaedae]QKS70259.1 tail protein X [Paenalkalicoccus suaedae]